MHNACIIVCLTKAEVILPSLTHPSPSPTEVCPKSPVSKRVENLQQLLVFLQQKRAKTNGHIKELAQTVPLTATAGV